MRNYIVSAIGAKLSQESGILELMNDLGETVALRPDMLTLGGGNPAEIPEMQTIWRKSAERLMKDGDEFDKAVLLFCYLTSDAIFELHDRTTRFTIAL